jgi:hypothetical protein
MFLTATIVIGGFAVMPAVTGRNLAQWITGTGGTVGPGTGSVACTLTVGAPPGPNLLTSPNFVITAWQNGQNYAGITTSSGAGTVYLNPGVYTFKIYPAAGYLILYNPITYTVSVPNISTGGAAAATYAVPMFVVWPKPASYVFTVLLGSGSFQRACTGIPDNPGGTVTSGLATLGLTAGTPFTVTFSAQVNTAYAQLGMLYTDPLFSGITLQPFIFVAINNTAQNAIFSNYPSGSYCGYINGTVPFIAIPIPVVQSSGTAGFTQVAFSATVPATSGHAYMQFWYGYNTTVQTIYNQHSVSPPPSTVFLWNGAITTVLNLMVCRTYLGI